MTLGRALVLSLSTLCSVFSITQAQEPLRLEEAIRLALARNYALRVEAINVPIEKANVTAEWGRFDPSFRASYLYQENGSPQPSDPFSGTRPPSSIETSDSYKAGIHGLTPWGLEYDLGAQTINDRGTFNDFAHRYYSFSGLSVTQPLLRNFGFGAGLASLRIAKLDRAMSEWDYRRTVTDTVTQVIFAYHNLYLALQNLRVAQRSRERAADLLSENEHRFKVGDVAESDVTTARARVAFREDSILRAQRLVGERTSELRQLISDDKDLAHLMAPLSIDAPGIAEKTQVDPAGDFPQALAQHPEYQRMRLQAQRTRVNRTYQSNQLLPQIDFVGSYGYHGFGTTWPESRRNLEDRETHSYSAGAVLNVPLTFAQQRGRYRAATLQVKQAEIRVDQWEQQVLVDLGNAAADVESTQKRMAAAQHAREVAQQSLADEVKLHRAGKTSTINVLTAQDYLSQAESNEYQTNADAHKALAEYDRQVGRTLARHRIELEEPLPKTVPRS